jgi:hypothetical protein
VPLVEHPRFELHFTPTYSSWLNQIERWFAELQRRRLDRGVFCSIDELTCALEQWIKFWNENAKPFKWSKTADQIIDAIGRYCARTGTLGCADAGRRVEGKWQVMGRQQWWGRGLAVAAVVAVAGCTALEEGRPSVSSPASGGEASPPQTGDGSAGPSDGTLPGVPGAEEARSQLAGLKVAAHGSMAGYSRDLFSHWSAQGENCDTRETVLERDGTGVQRDAECRAVSGSWVSVYDGKELNDASELDIDHMVPLANAWRSGADTWDADTRKAFANDLTHPQLLAVSASSNRSKGDQGPDEWQPPAETYWCTYSRAWTSVKATYELTVTETEKDMLTGMLDTCTP